MMNFCVAILTLNMGENTQHFRHIMLHYFKKDKNATEMQEKICAVHGEGAVTDRMCQKWFVKLRAGDFSLDDAPQSGRPVEVDGNQMETLRTINTGYQHAGDSQYTQNIQINKVISENEKCVSYFTEKTKWTFWPTQ